MNAGTKMTIFIAKALSKCTVPENIQTHPKEARSIIFGNSEGEGGVSQKLKLLKESMKLYWKYQWVSNQNTFRWGYGYFLEPHNVL